MHCLRLVAFNCVSFYSNNYSKTRETRKGYRIRDTFKGCKCQMEQTKIQRISGLYILHPVQVRFGARLGGKLVFSIKKEKKALLQ